VLDALGLTYPQYLVLLVLRAAELAELRRTLIALTEVVGAQQLTPDET
jgi:hypothetical protein